MDDQHRSDFLGAYGADFVHTPNIDSLADQGVVFDNAFAPCPLCAPARISLATGRHPYRMGALDNETCLPLSHGTYYQQLRDHGYRVATIGKLDLAKAYHELGSGDRPWTYSWGFTDPLECEGKMVAGTQDRPSGPYTNWLAKRGLFEPFRDDYRGRARAGWIGGALHDSVLPAEAHEDVFIGEQATRWVKNAPDDAPWHLFVSFVGPHDPFDPPTSYADRYRTVDVPPPQDRYGGKAQFVHRRLRDLSLEEVTRARRQYLALIELIDDQVGSILQALEERGERENTVIIFASDHGEMLGDKGAFQKLLPYRASAQVPVIITGPGLARGGRSPGLIELHDINPTIVELAGLIPEPGIDGRSFMQLLAEPQAQFRESILMTHLAYRAIRTQSDLYVQYNGDGEQELYDLEEDPTESCNVFAQSPERTRQVRGELRRRLHHYPSL